MDFFSLNYGAIDIILTPDGKHVFLELNPCGEFFWLEHSAGLPISNAIADLLLGHSHAVRNYCWIGSVPPRGSGWVRSRARLTNHAAKAAHPPATARWY
jgi:hypothetical protein